MSDSVGATLNQVSRALRIAWLGVLVASGCAPSPMASPELTPITEDAPADDSSCSGMLPDFSQSVPPSDVTSGADLTQLAVFAWQHFVALNWTASSETSGRGMPDTTATFFLPSGTEQPTTTVWQSYRHKNELYPAGASATSSFPDVSYGGAPAYRYSNLTGACTSSDTDPNALTNLDESSQLDLDYIFSNVTSAQLSDLENYVVNGTLTPGFDPVQILFQAKVNQDDYDYIVSNKLYYETAGSPRKTVSARNKADLNTYGGICQQTQGATCNQGPFDPSSDPDVGFCLPCGGGSTQGAIHVKAAWRRLTADEDKSRYYVADKVVFYKSAGGDSEDDVCYSNGSGESYGLVGLHIIHKTQNLPAFMFATWEHVDNPGSNLAYVNTENGGPIAGQAVAWQRVSHAGQTLPAPDVAAVNGCVQQAIEAHNTSSVWQNYRLVGVQGPPVDYQSTEYETDEADFFLANNVVESNDFFQSFLGNHAIYSASGTGPAGTTPGVNVTLASTDYDVGGCQGCHGNAQHGGQDFSFLGLAGSGVADADAIGEFSTGASLTQSARVRRYHEMFQRQ